ncbi:hypothetical protein L6164_022015 [Bauhinia variegata]|uniref:Uncharacterized protein n=1 Tax=Bauhinia variegata TaxID=167791 RepID=A0ACB9MF86_BAUVA|nr:hypothetical protein L6164_022015 [Bauhinia variegata]
MGEKKTEKNDAGKKEEKNKKNDGGKKEESPNTVVLKVDMHCDGCASKIIKSARRFEGVESVKSDANKLTVVGKLDPSKLRDKLALKTKKKVEVISPQPKKESKESKAENNKKSDDKSKKKADGDEKKPKEPPVTTAVLKVALHCQGCIEKISKTVRQTKGVHDMSMDKEKETITVKGTMDAKALAENLQQRLKRKVEIVPPKKEKDKEKENKEGGAEKEGGGNSGGKKKKGGGAGGGGGGDNNEKGGVEGGKMDKMEYYPVPWFGHGYGPVYMEQVHAPQMFSDENPNACSVM